MIKSIIQVLSFVSKETAEILRQPRLVLSLLLGPLLILLLFGLSYSGEIPEFRVALVVPTDMSEDQIAGLKDSFSGNLSLVSVDANEEAATEMLRKGQANLVEVLPAGVEQNVTEGRQSTVKFIYAVTSPFDERWIEFLCAAHVNQINRALLMGSIEQAQSQSGMGEEIPPETLVSPLEPEFTNLYGESLSYVDYYAPGVLALILQHIAVTLGALAIVREKERGILEMFRVAPLSAWNIIIGKYLGYLIFLMILSIALGFLLVYLGTPFLGSYTLYAVFMALYILAALGIGFLISCVSNSDTTAIQLSMLVLLVSMLFSGFFLALDSFAQAARLLSEAIPLTQAIQGLQSIMLKGTPPDPMTWVALSLIAISTFALVQLLFRRQLRRIYV